MVNSFLRHQGDSIDRNPFPESHLFNHVVSFHFRLYFDVEDLQHLLGWEGTGKQTDGEARDTPKLVKS